MCAGDREGCRSRSLVFPALLDRLAYSLGVLLSVVLVEIRGLDVGGGAGVGIVEETIDGT